MSSRPSTPSSAGGGADNLTIGLKVITNSGPGIVRFHGTTSFATGKWVGVELSEPKGKNDGSVMGMRYFECPPLHGLFLRASQVKIEGEDDKSRPTTPSSSRRSVTSTSPKTSRTSSSSRLSNRRPRPEASSLTNALPPSSKVDTLKRDSTNESAAASSRDSLPLSAGDGDGDHSNTLTSVTPPEGMSAVGSITTSLADLSQPTQAPSTPSPFEKISTRSTSITTSDLPTTLDSSSSRTHATTSYPSTPSSSAVQDRLNQTVPIKDYEELKLKLSILESKRANDREKIRELEKLKAEAEDSISSKQKMSSKVSELQTELREVKKQLKESNDAREILQDKYNEIMDSLEIVTLDKEVAEEKVESLTQELVLLNDKLEELQLDFEVLKSEKEIEEEEVQLHESGELPNSSATQQQPSSNIEIVQLQRQNERLKEALIKLRDVTTEQEAEFSRRIRMLEKDSSALQEFKTQNEALKAKLSNAENIVEELKLALEDASGAEELVEELSEKNLMLSEKVEEMKIMVDDLEALKELNDELEENHVETEKQLLAEIDMKDAQNQELIMRIDQFDETVADYENTINQFRTLVQNLQNDLSNYRSQTDTTSSTLMSSQTQELMTLNMKLQSNVSKAQAKGIELELRKLEASQAMEELEIVKSYLPSTFFQTEQDAIRCFLLMKRLVYKSNLLLNNISDYHSIESIDDVVLLEKARAEGEMKQKLSWLSGLAKRFTLYMQSCSIESFLKLGECFHDVSGMEKRLDFFIEQVQKEEFNSKFSIGDLQRSVAALEHLHDKYIPVISSPSTKTDTQSSITHSYIQSLIESIELICENVNVDVKYLKGLFAPPGGIDDASVITSFENVLEKVVLPLNISFGPVVTSTKSTCKKIIRRLMEIESQGKWLKEDFYHVFMEVSDNARVVGDFWRMLCSTLSDYVKSVTESASPTDLDDIKNLVKNVKNDVFERMQGSDTAPNGGPFDLVLDLVKRLSTDLSEKFETIGGAEVEIKGQPTTAPWVQRSQDLKQEKVVDAEMETKVQTLNQKIVGLMTSLKMKDQELQESHVKIELLEKRMNDSRKQSDILSTLETDLAKSRRQGKVYEEAIENLQSDLEAIENENSQLKKMVKRLERKRGSLERPDDSDSVTLGGSGGGGTAEMGETVRLQLESLRIALRHLRAENAQLKAKSMLSSLKLSIDALNIQPSDQIMAKSKLSASGLTGFGLISSDSIEEIQNEEKKNDEVLKNVTMETRVLMKEIKALAASPRIVTLSNPNELPMSKKAKLDTTSSESHPLKSTRWRSIKTTPAYQVYSRQALLQSLQKKAEKLKEKAEYAAKSRTGERVFGVDKRRSLPIQTHEPSRIGAIKVPTLPSMQTSSLSLQQSRIMKCTLKSMKEFETVHNVFVN